jgi:hypothetical protein
MRIKISLLPGRTATIMTMTYSDRLRAIQNGFRYEFEVLYPNYDAELREQEKVDIWFRQEGTRKLNYNSRCSRREIPTKANVQEEVT